MEVIDGSPEDSSQFSSGSPDSPAVRVLLQTWQEVAAAERKMLGEITLADLLERAKDQAEQMYQISTTRFGDAGLGPSVLGLGLI